MLNMDDLRSYDIQDLNVLLASHIVYTFVVSIMMINFFIALLSNSVSKIFQNHNAALCHQRAAVSYVMEQICSTFLLCVYQRRIRQYFTHESDKTLLLHVDSLLNQKI